MNRLLKTILAAGLMLSLTGCGKTEKTADQKPKEPEPTAETEKNTEEQEKTKTEKVQPDFAADWDDTRVIIQNTALEKDDEGNVVLRVFAKFINQKSEGLYLYECFAVHAFQNGVELEEVTDVNEDPSIGNSAGLIKEVKDGASVEASYTFLLNDESEITLRVCAPTAEEELLLEEYIPYSRMSLN